MNFIAFDFETANGNRSSACSLAIAIVRNNEIVKTFYTLINPETYFSNRNIQIHGITPEAVADAPTFIEVWQKIKPLFNPGSLIVAHNAPFDNGVLRESLRQYNEPVPQYLTLDTVRTSRKFFPNFENHKLNTVANNLQIDLEHHHNALDDTIACANILLIQQKTFGDEQLKPFIKPIN